ncbi:hypothetical protein [Bacillus sp. EB600]|uniref:hypothetical protein n=1 Tax=Bacillus sp. EB600 TaxID=2806345 RepID=UPI00210C4BD8|nr:hypothetical protein [Bacillus sp. EB600]MCQ6280285.1 hypothetical protein [Bacillus sp. EB600]
MRKKFLLVSALAVILTFGTAAAVLQSQSVHAKNEPAAFDAKKAMAKYSAPTKKGTVEPIRKSRLKQQNIVGEAANILNVLPIAIIDEMKKGKTLVQIAKEKGLSEQQFAQKLADFDSKMVNAAVKEGTITQEHADAINAGRADRLKSGIQEKAMDVNDHMAMDMGN